MGVSPLALLFAMLRLVIESRIEKCWMLSLGGGTSRSPTPFAADPLRALGARAPSPATASDPAAAVPRNRLRLRR